MANRINQNIVAAFSKPAHNPAKVWTAVKKDYFFFGSFDFATFEEAKEYLVQQIGRAGYAVAHGTYFDGSAPIFRDTFIINRETFQTWTLADLGLAYERSNSWSSKRNFCLTPAQHAARLERVNAYLAKRKARANQVRFIDIKITETIRNEYMTRDIFHDAYPRACAISETVAREMVEDCKFYCDAFGPDIHGSLKRAYAAHLAKLEKALAELPESVEPAETVLQDIESEGFEDAGLLPIFENPYSDEKEAAAYLARWNAHKRLIRS